MLLDGCRALVRALLDLLAAEVAEVQREIGETGRALVGIAVRLLAVAALAFWSLGALLFAAVAVLAHWLPPWGAALILAGVLGLAAFVLYRLARARIAALESPATTVRRRFDDHLAWIKELVERDQPDRDELLEDSDEGDAQRRPRRRPRRDPLRPSEPEEHW